MKSSKSPKGPVLHRLIPKMSNAAYHSVEGTWSSSQLKDMIDDEEVFIKKHIRNQKEKLEGEALDTGTYLHTGILEPHLVAKEIAVYEGKTRYGKQWEEFKRKHPGKTIITQRQKDQGDGMIAAVKNSPVSMSFLEGEAEISLFTKIIVSGGEIYAPHYSKRLTLDGWEPVEKMPSKGYELTIKVRADCLGDTFISDLKSTSGRANKPESVRGSISKYKYDLSAALYLDMFSLIREDVTDFLWIFASKENPIAVSWRASDQNIRIGRAKWSFAVKRMAELAKVNWETVDMLMEAEPLPFERDWLETKIVRDIDLL